MPPVLQRILASRRLAPPAIWGRLPAHADFVRSGMRHGESEGWSRWLAQQDLVAPGADARANPPTAFVLPPGTLSFAPRQFVIGVIVPSSDKAGRRHPLLVYQRASRAWLQARLGAMDSPAMAWLTWLVRAVMRHVPIDGSGGDGLPALVQTVDALWALHALRMEGWQGSRAVSGTAMHELAQQCVSLLGADADPGMASDLSVAACGNPAQPWGDWPKHVFDSRAKPAFWQQDVHGNLLGSATRLHVLWRPQADWHDLSPLADIGLVSARGAEADPIKVLGLPRMSARNAADLAGGVSEAWFDGLHAEFVRTLCDAPSLTAHADWQAQTVDEGDAPPSLEDLTHLAARFARVRDILIPRDDVTRLIDEFETPGAADFLAAVPMPEVLRLFAPELARARHAELPMLTRREHHALSPDSHMSVTRQPGDDTV
ncbi:hypothetical protein BH10PSE18_BH10PSE18_47730 [soil metagenome]